jgi:hypothetical protein
VVYVMAKTPIRTRATMATAAREFNRLSLSLFTFAGSPIDSYLLGKNKAML